MDIEQWLKDTAEAEAPQLPAHNKASDFFYRAEQPRPIFQEKRARKRGKSDSSLLDPQPVSQKAPPEKPKPPTEPAVDENSEATHSSRTESTESESSSQPYARKPRRKTRAERYEPKQKKERGKHVHQSRMDKSKKTRRKSKRRKGETVQSGVAQSFDAKNVSRDRLTLKPKDHLGIFNKGKTSVAVRGRGLPDLVFSEMKFLQKEKDASGPATQHGAPTKKRRKDHVHTKEGEISAYFTSVRPALLEKDSNVPTGRVSRQSNDVVDKAARRGRELSQKSRGVVPTIEMPGKGPYLGFGSRGPQHDSTGYVSWSESIRAPETTPQRRDQAIFCTQDVSSKHSHIEFNPNDAMDSFKRPAHPSMHDSRTGTSAECFRMSSVVPATSRLSRSHSYPQRTSSPRKVKMVDRATQFRSTVSIASPSSMPPSVPLHVGVEPRRISQERGIGQSPTTTHPSIPQHNRVVNEINEAHVEQGTSSDLERVIQRCNHTFREQQLQANEADIDSPFSQASNMSRCARPESNFAAHRRPTVRFSGIETYSRRLPNFVGSSIYERQAQRQDELSIMFEGEENLENSYSYMLADGFSLEQESAYGHDDMLYAAESWDEREALPYRGEGTLIGEPHQGEKRMSGDMALRISSDNGAVAPGFWRPNRLY